MSKRRKKRLRKREKKMRTQSRIKMTNFIWLFLFACDFFFAEFVQNENEIESDFLRCISNICFWFEFVQVRASSYSCLGGIFCYTIVSQPLCSQQIWVFRENGEKKIFILLWHLCFLDVFRYITVVQIARNYFLSDAEVFVLNWRSRWQIRRIL